MSLDRHGDKMIAERKGRTVNHGKEAIEMALQRIASVAKILRKGAIVMLRGRSQLNENLQGDECILQQISALRRENRFLKVGLIFCLVLSALPYLTGFQLETIRAKRLIVEQIDFAKGELVTLSIAADEKSLDLVIKDATNNPVYRFLHPLLGRGFWVYGANGKPTVFLSSGLYGGGLALLNNDGSEALRIGAEEFGGGIVVFGEKLKPAVRMKATLNGGVIGVLNKDGNPVAGIGAGEKGGRIEVINNEGKLVWSAP
jgi:hypothetical protein